MRTAEELIEKSANRLYIEPDQNIMPGITHLGRLDFSSAAKALEPHTHGGAVEFCYLERGYAVFQCGREKWQLKGGECFVSYSGEVHGTGSHPLERMKLFWIGYKPEIIVPFLTAGCSAEESANLESAMGSALPRTFIGSARMGAAINTTLEAYIGRSRYRSVIIKSALLNLFLHLADKKSKPVIISHEMKGVIDYINRSLAEGYGETGPDLAGCARMAGLSLSRFKSRFKSETGVPPGEFILRKRIERAQELLLTGMPVTSAAYECGFSSSQYFASVFRRYKNCSPTGYLRKTTGQS